jgi:hypothetical protein
MKKILKLSLLLVVVLTTMQTYAGEGDFLLYVKKGNGKAIRFALNGVQRINLSIYDNDGSLLFTENATDKLGILRTYSLEEFPEGTYFLEVENNLKKVRYEIIVTNNVASLSKSALAEVYKPTLNKNVKVATL